MYRELGAFIRIRQDNLTSDLHNGTVRATTILVTSIPKQFLDVKTLRQVFSVFPGGVKNVFLNRDCSDLLDMVQLRDSIAHRLEGAETELICTANKLHRKEMAKKAKHTKKKQKKAAQGEQVEEAEERIEIGENESLVDRYVPNKKRPTYRIPLAKWMPSLPLIGKKVSLPKALFLIEQVDTVKWAREELKKMNPSIARLQARPERFDPMNSAFIQFNTQLAAHMACQSVTSHTPMFMTPRYIETAPQDVVWGNMQLVWWQRVVRVYLINMAIAALIVFYAIPTAFVGSISNITYLTNLLPWLRWIYNLPPQLLGLVTGLLPAVMLTIWLAILPFILRIACLYQGWPTRTVIELKVQDLYFAFMVLSSVIRVDGRSFKCSSLFRLHHHRLPSSPKSSKIQTISRPS
jgi:calcium permeable stress-gated cation channel